MKKSLILLAAIFGILANVEAKPVDVSTAAAAAERFRQAPLSYSLTNGSVRIPRRTAATPYTLTDDSYSAFYVFSNPNGNGFVMIAKDDRLSPIIAYSDNNPWSTEDMPDNLREWLEGYCSMMPYLDGEQSAEVAAEWQALFSNNFAPCYPDTPLMETKWGQSPYYNALCPTNEKEGQAVTGCEATAFAQVLRYWKYPEHGWGFHAYTDKRYGYLSADFSQHYYDWDHMPVALNEKSNSTEILAVAQLISDCGIAIDMGYGPRGSGASTSLIATRIVRYFGYKPTAQLVERADYPNDEEWLRVIRNEVDNDRVMIYRGTGSRGGHCFVCDGYDSSSRIHINWGWMGNCDGYFSVKAMNPKCKETMYDYTQEQMAIIGIEPDINKTKDTVAITYADPWKLISETGDIEYGVPFAFQTKLTNEGDAITCDLMAMLFDEDGDYLRSWTVEPGFTMNAHEQKEIRIDSVGKMNLLPGNYQMALYVAMPDSSIFIIDADEGAEAALHKFTVKHWNEVELNGIIVVNDTLPVVVRGQEMNLSTHISYVGQSSYTGAYRWALYELDKSTPCDTLASGSINGWSGMDTTLQATVTPLVPQGTYQLALLIEQEGEQVPVGSRYYPNPINLIVQDTIAIDRYEPNDVPESATPVTIDFEGKDTVRVSIDASIHWEGDVDFYVLQLPQDAGYKYEQIAEVTYSDYPYLEAPVDVLRVEDKWLVVPQSDGMTGYYSLWFTVIRKETPVKKITLTAEDFVISDNNVTYDGTIKTVSVNMADETKILPSAANMTVYYSADKTLKQPKNAGTYQVYIDIKGDSRYNDVEGLTDEAWALTIAKADPTADLFTYTAPEGDAYYDGKAREAKVEFDGQDKFTGMGAVTIKYNGETDAPIAAGDYTVSIDVAEGANYNAATGLTDEDWRFTIVEPAPVDEWVTVRTDVTVGEYGTICLPRKVTEFKGATFYEVIQFMSTVKTDEVTTLQAGRGYIFQATESSIQVKYTGEAVLEPKQVTMGLQGTFVAIQDGAAGTPGNVLEGNYIFINNQFRKCAGACSLAPYRAYLLNERFAAEGIGDLIIDVVDEPVTDLGDRLQATGYRTMKVIKDGHFMIIRDNKVYNAQGIKIQ